MNSKLMSADEKRNRKNEMVRIRRANGKQNSVVDTEMPEPESYSVPEPEPELPQAEPEPTAEEIEMKRKEVIAEKRRQSLILARSKITPKNVSSYGRYKITNPGVNYRSLYQTDKNKATYQTPPGDMKPAPTIKTDPGTFP